MNMTLTFGGPLIHARTHPTVQPRFAALDNEDWKMFRTEFSNKVAAPLAQVEGRIVDLEKRMAVMISLMERMAKSMERTEAIFREYFGPDAQNPMP
jgi:hypothetical protein